jgi:GNAT superfamily N-acetyltransferase
MLTYRKLMPPETGRLKAHLLRLDEEDRRLRFGHFVSPQVILAYVDAIDWQRTWIIGAFEDGVLRGVAELRDTGAPGHTTPDLKKGGRCGELSVSVEPGFRRQGVGTRLLQETLLIARNRAFDTLYLLCLPENRQMQRLAARFAGQLSFQDGDVEVRLKSPQPDPLSFFAELLGDALSFWTAAVTRPAKDDKASTA